MLAFVHARDRSLPSRESGRERNVNEETTNKPSLKSSADQNYTYVSVESEHVIIMLVCPCCFVVLLG